MDIQVARERMKQARAVQRKVQELGLRIIETDPWVPVKIQGVDYKLEFSFGAVQEVFRKTGVAIGFDQITSADLADLNLFPSMLLAGLRTHHGDKFPIDGEESLMRLIPVKHFMYYQTVMTVALQATQPDAEEIDRLNAQLGLSLEEPESPLAPDSTSVPSGHVVGISA